MSGILQIWEKHHCSSAHRRTRSARRWRTAHGATRSPRAEERTAFMVRCMTGYAETATMGLCGDRLSDGRTACPRVREEGRRCGGDIVPPQRTREPGVTRVDVPERERDGAAARPRWRMLRSVDVGGTAVVLRRADMMAPWREGARQERRHEE
jgi:hypothetical protein